MSDRTAMLARVVVTPKPVVNDPQGVTVKRGLRALGFDTVEDVRVGKHIEIRLTADSVQAARAQVEDMCRRLLANHVIEDYRFQVDPVPEPSRAGAANGDAV